MTKTRRPRDTRNIRERPGALGTTYLVELRLKGQGTARQTFDTLTEARNWRDKTRADIKANRYVATVEARRHTFADMIDAFLEDHDTSQATRSQLEWWKNELGDLRLSEVTRAKLLEKKRFLLNTVTRRKEKMTRSTCNRYLSALRHVFETAVGELIAVNPMAGKGFKDKEPRGRVRYLTEVEREKLLAACQESSESLLYPLAVLAISTGARAGELLALRWQDLYLDKGNGTLHHTKNGERRALPVKGHALALLKAMEKVRRTDTDLVFPSRGGIKPFDYHKPFKAAVAVAEVSDFRFHDLRHTTASYLAMNGATMPELAAVLGHKTLEMVKRYAHLSDAHVANAVEAMNTKIFGTPPKTEENATDQ